MSPSPPRWVRMVFYPNEADCGCAEYVVSMPNMYARGILWGKMVLELGDSCTARNERNGFSAELQFKTKGYFSGTYNAIAGRVRRAAPSPSSSHSSNFSSSANLASGSTSTSGASGFFGSGAGEKEKEKKEKEIVRRKRRRRRSRMRK